MYSDYYRDQVARGYRDTHEKQSWWHREQRSMKMLLSQIEAVHKVLDVPFGTGRFLGLYSDLGYSVSGFDISEDMFVEARKQWEKEISSARLVTGDARKLPFENGEFDLVVSTRFLQSILTFGDAKKAISEFCRVSRRFLILGLDFRADKHFRLKKPKDTEPMSGRLRLRELEAILRDFGFELRDSVGPFKANGQQFHLLFEKSVVDES